MDPRLNKTGILGDRGGIRVSRGGNESGQVRGSAGGLEKLSTGVSGLVKKTLDCTVEENKILKPI